MDKERREIIVIGATNTDISGKCLYPLVMEDSNLGKVSMSLGGVAHNIALNLSLLGKNVTFITSLGSDVFGDNGRREMENIMDISEQLKQMIGEFISKYDEKTATRIDRLPYCICI